ncbi:hypothetical protein [Delftia acidovorans]|uniref:hypothetical protein n=1 Tax=Delftia acidovorans TaxID=80866 RepID=UPI003D09F7CD
MNPHQKFAGFHDTATIRHAKWLAAGRLGLPCRLYLQGAVGRTRIAAGSSFLP